MTTDHKPQSESEIQEVNTQASVLMKRGISLLAESHTNALLEALACFDQALELRLGLPINNNPLLRFGLAACWLNRADALSRLAGTERIDEALHSYDEGIALLRTLPFNEDTRFPRRLAIACQNRGLALQRLGASRVAETIDAFTEAIEVLNLEPAASISDRQHLLGVIWMNLANAHASERKPECDILARDAARHALALVADSEANDADAAEVGLKARHALCQTLAASLSQPKPDGESMSGDVHEATDLVDDGLALIRHWEQRGVARFRTIGYDLFRFGARVYAKYQPQFLNEFVLDHIDPKQWPIDYIESTPVQVAIQEALDLKETRRSS